MSLFRALNAEVLKLKRTLAFRVVFVLPLLIAVLQFFVIVRTKKYAPGFNLWQTHGTNSFQIWAVFMLPLLIALVTALLNGIEHSDKQWKHLFALPVPRSAAYFAKLIVAEGFILTNTVGMGVFTAIVGAVGMYLRPELGNARPVPYLWLAKQVAFIWLASWLIIAIHAWISMRWAGFPIALGAGIGGRFFG